MKLLKNGFIVIIASLALFSCNPLKQLQTEQSNAEKSFASGNYSQAYTQLSQLISKLEQNSMDVPVELLMKAATSASETGNYSAAVSYYKKSLADSATVDGVKGIVKGLNAQKLYKEVAASLTQYSSVLESNGEIEYLYQEVFQNHVNTNNTEGIISSFSKVSNPTEEQAMIYITTLETAGKKKDALKYCNQLVKDHPDYFKAREWKGKYYYEFAEDWYKSEMNKYNKDKNYTAYVYLKRELKKISSNYRVAKGEYEALHKQFPDEKKYIKYLKNIYLRLEMKNEANVMEKLLQ